MSTPKSTKVGRASFEVDPGPPANRCSRNVGANKPEEAGLYFSWGDTKGYRESEIEKCMLTEELYKRLHASKIKGNLKLKDDAAHEYLKGDWHIPSDKEFHELKSNTKQTVEVLNGIKGIRFTAKNGNSIFIPFAGFAIGSSVKDNGSTFGCWSSLLYGTDDSYYFRGDLSCNVGVYSLYRFLCFSVRAVCGK